MPHIKPTLSAESELNLVACEVSSQRTIEWAVLAPDVPRYVDRAPINLALVLDRSGSMQRDKLKYVQQAACYVLDLLNERDRVALVAYDDQVSLISASQPLTEQARSEMKERINALVPGGWTDLSGGWLEGCRAIAEYTFPEGINRALLLTDGMANRGITDIEELTHHARELLRRGISTSTFGVGLDFNEHFLEALAAGAGGHFYYIERPEQIPDVFRQELGELLSVVAREVFLNISIPRGVSVELIGDLPHEQTGERLRIFLGDLSANQRRLLYTRVLTPPDAPGTSVVLRAELGYADLDGRTETVTTTVQFTYTREAEVRRAPLSEGVLQRASEIELAATANQALQLERTGQRQQAQALMQRALAVTSPYMSAAASATYQSLSEQIGHGLDEGQRKQSHYAAYKARQSRD